VSWKHRILADAAALPELPPQMPAADAQAWANFVVWTPGTLPAGCTLTRSTVRMEAPPGRVDGHTVGRTPWCENNPTAYRFEVEGPGRRLRVKQFLYDWTFPALDHPCLWGSAARPMPIHDRDVVWFGTDYQRLRAASARLSRTTVELAVLDGEFSDEEIHELYASLRPADPQAALAVHRTPFAELSYWARRDDAVILNVPVGLWSFHRNRDHTSRWLADVEAEPVVKGLGLPLAIGEFRLDSTGHFVDAEGREETEIVYAGGPDRGREVRIIAQRPGRGSLHVPAEAEPGQPGHRSVRQRLGAEVQLAWVDERYGAMQAVFTANGLDLCVLSTSGVGMDVEWFLTSLDTIVHG
jgi:hypothetical protein